MHAFRVSWTYKSDHVHTYIIEQIIRRNENNMPVIQESKWEKNNGYAN